MNIPSTWEGEKRLYERQVYSAIRVRSRIIDIRPEEGELGYTGPDRNIHLAYAHPMMEMLDDSHALAFRYGVFTHELLHQIFTSFSYLSERIEKRRDAVEKKVLSLLANLVEDPAIEYFAPTEFGGEMLEALHFSIRHIYEQAPVLSESASAFSQFVNALVMFGDMGLLKGEFTYPEAEEYFRKIAPEFQQAVTNPNPRARIDAAERWMILTRPLWYKEAREQEEFMKHLEELLDSLQSGEMNGEGNGKTADDYEESDDRSNRRKAFASALTKESEESEDTEGIGGGSPGDEQDDSTEKESGEEKAAKNAEPQNGEAKGEGEGEECNRSISTPKPSPNHKSVHDAVHDFQDDGTYNSPDILSDTIDTIRSAVKDELKALQDEDSDTLNVPVNIPTSRGSDKTAKISCENILVNASAAARKTYQKEVEQASHDIRLLTNSIRQMLRADYDEWLRATSGRYALKRDLDHTTVRVFDKRREKKQIEDMAVFLLIDNSGSMSGRKISLARRSAIILAETFGKLGIPCYIMGFTADCGGSNVTHLHYLTWSGKTAEARSALADISAYANNDDGYSIRYATGLLKKKQAEHKLLFVISDGAPACRRYQYSNGITDTAAAILDAKKVTDIFGIGIGMEGTKELSSMYRGNYINIYDASELAHQLTKQLKRIIRSWMG